MAITGADAEEYGFSHSWWEFQFYDTCCGKQDGDSPGNNYIGAAELVLYAKTFATKPCNLCWIPGTHTGQEESHSSKLFSDLLCMCAIAPAHTYIHNKK